MPITTVSVGAAITPTVIKTYISHYTNRNPRRKKPTAHISYDEGLHLVRSFLSYASHHTVEDLQAFTAQWVPTPTWVRTKNITISEEHITRAADALVKQLGPEGVEQVGGTKWWQWRRKNVELKAEWIEMRSDYNARKHAEVKSKRIMLYVHGGAYFFGSVDEHRYQMQRHARKLKARVLAPRYRLAPQFPFPCGLQDCLAAYLFLLSQYEPAEIIMAGDSAGGGMIVSILCLLRDQGVPLPAGAILISPWVDLTHSFPSVAAVNEFDYIPAHGFMHRPSASWPPPNDDEIDAIQNGAGKDLLTKRNKLEKAEVEREAAQGFAVRDLTDRGQAEKAVETGSGLQPPSGRTRAYSNAPGPHRHLQIEIDGKIIELKDQIQMYAPNQLLSHPLVSPALQPSLGGLPPMLILTGGGEVLRDEQIYLAHKAANPSKYPLGGEYRARYDPEDTILNKHKPTFVQLQVWEDLCHVAPTLSFTRPAKFMYRSVAQFGAWALARAQKTSIELTDDDNISIISSDSNSSSANSIKKQKLERQTMGSVGRAGDPIPVFKHHMIRQLVDRHGNLHALPPETELPALQLEPSEVGTIKVGPVKKWMEAKLEWDTKYARIKRKVQKRRIRDLVKGDAQSISGERPPPSALAGRRKEEDILMRKPKKSYGLALWSGWGSKHDEDTIKREEEATKSTVKEDESQGQATPAASDERLRVQSRPRRRSDARKSDRGSRSRSRKRTVAVSDIGQASSEGQSVPNIGVEPAVPQIDVQSETPDVSTVNSIGHTGDSHLTPLFLPKFKTAPHLRTDSKDVSDTASVRTGYSVLIPDNASTTAVFSAAGVSRQSATELDDLPGANRAYDDGTGPSRAMSTDSTRRVDGGHLAMGGTDTPYSRRSVERLMSHQDNVLGDGASVTGTERSSGVNSTQLASRLGPLRSPSSMAIVQHEGVVDVVEGGVADARTSFEEDATPTQERGDPTAGPEKVVENGEVKLERPGLYDRNDTEFKTAMEQL